MTPVTDPAILKQLNAGLPSDKPQAQIAAEGAAKRSEGVNADGSIPGMEGNLDRSKAGDNWSTIGTAENGLNLTRVVPGRGLIAKNPAEFLGEQFRRSGDSYGAFETDAAGADSMKGGRLKPVTDPAILAQLNGAQEPAQGGLTGALEHKPGWTYGSVLPLARGPEGGLHMSLPDMIREPILSALKSGNKLEHGEVPQVNDYMPAVLATVGAGIRAPATAAAKAAPATIASTFAPKPTAPEQKAAQLVARAFKRDKVDPANAAQVIGRYPDKDIAVMDAGGSNVSRLARTVRTLPGEGSNNLETFLTERQNDQHNRVLKDITTNFANGADVHTLSDKLMTDRATTAKPLYDQAFKANQSIASPTIDRILSTPAGKQALASARLKMQNDQTLMGVPDAELRDQALESGQEIPKGGAASGLKLRTLDYVKRSLDDQIGAAQRSGERDNARILVGLKNEFVKAIDDADITARAGPNSTKPAGGLYAQARAAYSGPSQSLDAIENGKDFLKMDAQTLAKTIKDLPASDRDFFRVGAARALQDKIGGAQDNADVVPRVFGNKTIRAQIAAVFGSEAATKFAEAASAEKMATATNRTVRGGSNTVDKLADVADTNTIGRDAAHGFVTGGLKGAIALPALNYAHSKIDAYFHGMTPEVRAALADLLQRTGPSALSDLGRPNLPPRRLNNGAGAKAMTGTALSAFLSPPAEANRQRR